MTPVWIPRSESRLRPPTKPLTRITHEPVVVLHCTDGNSRPSTRGEACKRWRITQDGHQCEPRYEDRPDPKRPGKTRRVNVGGNGWADIGYNFGVTPEGEILEGRGWGVLGAHAAKGHNKKLGIVLFGKGQDMTAGEQAGVEWLAAELARRLGKPVRIIGHRDISKKGKKCPGPVPYAWLSQRAEQPAPAPQGCDTMAGSESGLHPP